MNLLSVIFRYKEKKSPDKLGVYPKEVCTEAFPERRYLWTSRFLVILASLSLSFTIMMAASLFLLIPSRRSQPRLLTENAYSTELETLNPQILNVKSKELLTEKLIEEYIRLRHEIYFSSSELFDRWETNTKFYHYSGRKNFGSFKSAMTNDKITSLIKQDLVRLIEIKSIKRIVQNLWKAEFVSTTSNQYLPENKKETWNAYMRVRYISDNKKAKTAEEEWKQNNYLLNPFGFIVDTYQLSYVGESGDKTTAMETANEIAQKTTY